MRALSLSLRKCNPARCLSWWRRLFTERCQIKRPQRRSSLGTRLNGPAVRKPNRTAERKDIAMEPDLSFDFDSPLRKTESRRWSWPIRSIGSLMVLIALSCLSMTVMARGPRRQTKRGDPGSEESSLWAHFDPKGRPGSTRQSDARATKTDRSVRDRGGRRHRPQDGHQGRPHDRPGDGL